MEPSIVRPESLLVETRGDRQLVSQSLHLEQKVVPERQASAILVQEQSVLDGEQSDVGSLAGVALDASPPDPHSIVLGVRDEVMRPAFGRMKARRRVGFPPPVVVFENRFEERFAPRMIG